MNEDLKIGIERDNGKIIGYRIDGEVINGLYITLDIEKINENCENFEIEIGNPKKGVIRHKLSKRDNLCILTIRFDKENQVQYLVGNDMDLIELNCIPEDNLPSDIKEMINEAFEISKKNRLSDFLK